jgi:polysaccharide export outer membrane protein
MLLKEKRVVIVFFCWILGACATEYKIIDQNSKEITDYHKEQTYLLGCGDRLSIKVWGKDDLNTDATIRPDGNISVPLIGDIQVKGLRVEDLKNELNKRLREYIYEPNVSVTVVEIKSLKIYVLGEVTRPGEFDMVAHSDVLRGIAMAGGFTIYAKKDKIQIIRTDGNEKIKIKFNYDQVIRGVNLNQNIPLQPGDVIIVP